MIILVATGDTVLRLESGSDALRATQRRRVTCIACHPKVAGRAWCGSRDGVLASVDGGATWRPCGLENIHVTALAPSPSTAGLLWAGTEPSAVWCSQDDGATWRRLAGLDALPSSSEWSFPPRPETHHVRWITPHPAAPGHIRVAIEAGALVTTPDGGRTWQDRVPGGPRDTHQLVIHPHRPDVLRSAAGDGFFESDDGGATWASPMEGLEVGYLRSIAIDPADPDTAIVSAASHAHRAYRAGQADGRVYRRRGAAAWQRVIHGWPDPPHTIAPLLAAGTSGGELYAADERGVHRSCDGGVRWETIAAFDPPPARLNGLAVGP